MKILLILGVLLLAACKDMTSPEGALGTAGSALQKSNLQDLQDTLDGEAYTKFGNQNGMVLLQQKLVGYTLQSKVTLTDTVDLPPEHRNCTKYEEDYLAAVWGTKSPQSDSGVHLLDAQISCVTRYCPRTTGQTDCIINHIQF